MGNYIILHNVPATPEGKAFIRQLRKYLPPEYKIRSRGNLKDRKGAAGGDARKHKALRSNVPVHMADRLRVYIDERPGERVIHNAKGWWYLPRGARLGEGQMQGPFKTYKAVRVAKRITEGTGS